MPCGPVAVTWCYHGCSTRWNMISSRVLYIGTPYRNVGWSYGTVFSKFWSNLFQLQCEIFNLHQKNISTAAYNIKMKVCWDAIESHQFTHLYMWFFKGCSCSSTIDIFTLFLMGLNYSYTILCRQLLLSSSSLVS